MDGRSLIHGCPGRPLGALWRALCAAALALGTLPAAAQAPAAGQGGAPVLTSPVPSGTAQPGAAGLPQGTGAGYHSPQSPLAAPAALVHTPPTAAPWRPRWQR